MGKFNPTKCKVTLKLLITRLNLLKNKKTNAISHSKADIALVLKKNDILSARINAEALIKEELLVETFSLIELYCEELIARIKFIALQKELPLSEAEALANLLFFSSRLDLDELKKLRVLFTQKYGKQCIQGIIACKPPWDQIINQKIIAKLNPQPPPAELVNLYLQSIADAHAIPFDYKSIEEPIYEPNLPLEIPTIHDLPSEQDDSANFPDLSSETNLFPDLSDHGFLNPNVNEEIVPSIPESLDLRPFNFDQNSVTKNIDIDIDGMNKHTPMTTNTDIDLLNTLLPSVPKNIPERGIDNDFDDLNARFQALKKR